MIGYVTLGTNDMTRAGRFYDDLLGLLGARRTAQTERYIAWGKDPDAPMLYVIKPADGQPSTIGNGVMIALVAKSERDVDRIYERAIALGGKDEGPAGSRGEGFYAGYFRDVDGNKLCAYFSS
ncbi:MAG TPA: VOC family protein [Steroidobacteraceae bacterium]|jgi:catechol 2,3-dioxygenase-like lactoylglutathione lyase family enzyme